MTNISFHGDKTTSDSPFFNTDLIRVNWRRFYYKGMFDLNETSNDHMWGLRFYKTLVYVNLGLLISTLNLPFYKWKQTEFFWPISRTNLKKFIL